MNNNMPENARSRREIRELRRLETLIDVVFALVIVMITVDLPVPENSNDALSFVLGRLEEIALSALGIAVLLIYWFQSNLLLGTLSHTDGKHATLAIFQVFMVLIYMLCVSYGVSAGNTTLAMVAQSVSAALVGFLAAAAWWYASHNRRLLDSEISDSEALALRLRVLAEPLTAVLTIVVAFLGPWLWEVAWFTYPVFAFILRRMGVAEALTKEKPG